MKQFLLVSILFFSVSATIKAQVQKVVADKIVAQVGDKIILRSDVMNAISDAKRQGQEASLPPHPECAFLEAQLIQKALVLQAEKDSLVVSDEDLDAALDNQIRGFIREYGSKEVLEEIAGKTIYQIKEDFRPAFRDRKLADQMRNKILENVKVTPNEVKAYFDKIPKDSLPFFESEIEVSQILAQPKANKEVEDYVSKDLYSYKKQVESGQKRFDQLAKLYSDDVETEKQGGLLHLNRNDKFWDPTFLATVFKLKEGQISPVIKSKFGLHIIQLVSRSGDDAVVRHILKIPPVTQTEIDLSVQKLDSVRNLIETKQMTFGEAVKRFSDDDNSKFTGGQIQGRDGSSYITIDQLPDKDLIPLLKTLKPGQISQPQVYTDDRGRKMVRLVYLKTRTEPHRENLKEDYNKIAQQALEDKKQSKLEQWFNDHLPNFYITIDKEFKGCKSLDEWWKYAARN
ncbi:MAG: peptidylprolyl isomerase [Hydrotalea sp. AMD]|uniref:peptidylprolyl isomerase n=1 Tax=Hydrotalea sp. AMD TaxID=2501297 RepID=UPI00102724B4|nr:peptidylprolyl isomerase [Hydrotalea sp. AMD]RWZ87436.1 MAG: peptidylprolyl isomerase [Hydrotalea sp. AMD]